MTENAGGCSDPVEIVGIYDFMASGTLYELLHEPGGGATSSGAATAAPAVLDRTRRRNIAVGVVQAIAHLHRAVRRGCCTRKSMNVLLDDSYVPLVADDGLMGLVTKAWVEMPGYTPLDLRGRPESIGRRRTCTDSRWCFFEAVLLELVGYCSHDRSQKHDH